MTLAAAVFQRLTGPTHPQRGQAELAQFQWLYHVDTRRVAVIPPGVDTGHFYPIPDDEAREFAGVPEDEVQCARARVEQATEERAAAEHRRQFSLRNVACVGIGVLARELFGPLAEPTRMRRFRRGDELAGREVAIDGVALNSLGDDQRTLLRRERIMAAR